MTKLKMHSKDLTQDNIEKIKALFPNCVSEATNSQGELRYAVDFDLLKQELSDNLVEGPQERYRLDWPGKREAMLLANSPIAKTLRPARDESVDFDTTENLFIEGDNLEALKLLQENYLGKIKMIYIDPPYNTGNDFVYNDDFAESSEEYFERSIQKDEEGNRLVANTESNGRYHSDWLSMMLPRLKLARNLLSDDGVVFISIDDNEVQNLKSICDEVFGEKNFLSASIVISNPRGRQSDTYVASVHDNLIIYSKNISSTIVYGMSLTEKQLSEFPLKDKNEERYRLLGLRQRGSASNREDRPNMFFPIYVEPNSHDISFEKIDGWEEVFPRKSDGRDGRWMWSKERCIKDKEILVARLIAHRNEFDIFVKDFLNKDGKERTRKFKSLWDLKKYNNQEGTTEIKSLFGIDVMSFPKSRSFLQDVCRMGGAKDDLYLDFFAGSSTTAHAIMQLNAEDGGNRKFIMVQLPEAVEEKHEAFKAGYKTIAEISKERIRRAGKHILEGECHENWNKDVGFRVLKVDSTNMKDVYYRPAELGQQDLANLVSPIKEDRSSEDLLFQVMLDLGLELNLPIRSEVLHGKTVFFVDENLLVACFDQDISEELVLELTKHKPVRVVFADSCFGANDSLKTNAQQIFKQQSPDTSFKGL